MVPATAARSKLWKYYKWHPAKSLRREWKRVPWEILLVHVAFVKQFIVAITMGDYIGEEVEYLLRRQNVQQAARHDGNG